MTGGHLQNPADADQPDGRTEIEAWKRAFQRNLFNVLGRDPRDAIRLIARDIVPRVV